MQSADDILVTQLKCAILQHTEITLRDFINTIARDDIENERLLEEWNTYKIHKRRNAPRSVHQHEVIIISDSDENDSQNSMISQVSDIQDMTSLIEEDEE